MPKTRVVSPARSQGDVATPKRKKSRGSRSLCSPALSTASGRLTSLIDQFKDKNRQSFALSPLNSRSVLNDNTDIEEPRRKSWWKKLDENSQAVMEVLEENKVTDANNLIEELIDIEVLSQEKKNFTLDLPESSDNESINSIVLPQRKLFTQKENQPQKKFGQLIGNRESLAKLQKTNTTNIHKAVNVGPRELFQNVKRSKPIFPAALLQISPNKTTADKTKENLVVEPKPQVRNIFGNRPTKKRKNIFADFIVSESEDEIPDIQPKVFGFQKKLEMRRISSISKGKDTSPTSSITTDIEMDDWKHLPSSTMVENQLEDMVAGHTPVKRARLSKLSEAKESEAGTNTLQTNTTGDKTKQSNKSTSSKNKTKSSPEIKDKTLDSSRTTRSMAKNTSIREELHHTSRKQDAKGNKSQIKTTKENALNITPSKTKDIDKQTTLNHSQKQNLTKTRNSTKATENYIESDETVVKAINDETKIIRKFSSKNKSSIITDKNENEEDVEMNTKVSIYGVKIPNKSNKTSSNNDDNNQEDDDEHNFTLQYENDIVDNEAMVNVSLVLDKDSQKDAMKKSRSNKSLSQIQKQDKTSNNAGDNVDGIQENDNEAEIGLNQESTGAQKDSNLENHEVKSKKNDSNQTENKINKSDENEEEEVQFEANHDKVNEANDKVNDSQETEDEHKITNESQEIQNESEDESGNESEVDADNEVNASEEVEDVANASHVETDVSDVNNDGANKSEEEEEANNSEDEEEVNASEDEEEVNASENEEEVNASENEEEVNASENEEANESKVDENESNESQEVEAEVNESQEEAHVSQSQEIEEEASESHVVDDDDDVVSEEDNNEEVDKDEEEAANESQDVSANENQVESEADVSESEEVEHDDQMDDSDESDKAIATDAETSEQDDNDEMEVDDDEPQEDDNDNEQNQVEQYEIEPSDEVIQESPDVTHDTTGRNRKKDLNKSPEAILNNRTNEMDSFTTKGRNTSARKTKSMIKNLNIRPSLAPPRDSIGFSDGTTNSTAEGSGWDSHRTTRKTLRQTFGKDFTPRKSLRALVMEKSAKRHTEHIDLHAETIKFPQANSTEFPEDSNRDIEDVVESDHEVSRRTRQTTLETYLQKIKQQNMEHKLKMEEAVRNSLKGPARDSLSLFKVPNKPAPRRPKPTQNKQKKQTKSTIQFGELPSEVIADMKYKPPKRFQPTNASWITKRLYRFLENKLEAKYDYKARVRAEKLVETIYHFAKDLRRHTAAPASAVDVLKQELARLDIVRTHFEFYEFFHEFMPREIRVKVVPDIVNKIPLPRHGVFSDILRGVKG